MIIADISSSFWKNVFDSNTLYSAMLETAKLELVAKENIIFSDFNPSDYKCTKRKEGREERCEAKLKLPAFRCSCLYYLKSFKLD